MVTTVSRVRLRDDAGPTWDQVMEERLEAVRRLPGWVSGQVLKPIDDASRRVIVGTWRSRSDWEEWHQSPAFRATRERLDRLEAGPREQWWHEVTVAAQR
ncbi:MAG TPA: antibiotic biosynthesis monooxygenase family protein [Candidatus Dormibacteraeota bacterium]|nr:antibiotic biosynthesis monooxygenase family protein [Candidatus Dormibacteraeota bacterium]